MSPKSLNRGNGSQVTKPRIIQVLRPLRRGQSTLGHTRTLKQLLRPVKRRHILRCRPRKPLSMFSRPSTYRNPEVTSTISLTHPSQEAQALPLTTIGWHVLILEANSSNNSRLHLSSRAVVRVGHSHRNLHTHLTLRANHCQDQGPLCQTSVPHHPFRPPHRLLLSALLITQLSMHRRQRHMHRLQLLARVTWVHRTKCSALQLGLPRPVPTPSPMVPARALPLLSNLLPICSGCRALQQARHTLHQHQQHRRRRMSLHSNIIMAIRLTSNTCKQWLVEHTNSHRIDLHSASLVHITVITHHLHKLRRLGQQVYRGHRIKQCPWVVLIHPRRFSTQTQQAD